RNEIRRPNFGPYRIRALPPVATPPSGGVDLVIAVLHIVNEPIGRDLSATCTIAWRSDRTIRVDALSRDSDAAKQSQREKTPHHLCSQSYVRVHAGFLLTTTCSQTAKLRGRQVAQKDPPGAVPPCEWLSASRA